MISRFTLRLGHHVQSGAEERYVNKLIRHARLRHEGLFEKDRVRWIADGRCVIRYFIPPESVVFIARQLGVVAPDALILRYARKGVRVFGVACFLPKEVRLTIVHTYPRMPRLLKRFTDPLVNVDGRAADQIIQMASEAFGSDFELVRLA